MKTHHSPRGKRMAVRLLAVMFAAIAGYTSHAIITRSDDSFSRNLGRGFNHALISLSKLGMGLSKMHDEMESGAAPIPQTAINESGIQPVARNTSLRNNEPSLLQRCSRSLAISSRDGFIAGSKFDIYGH